MYRVRKSGNGLLDDADVAVVATLLRQFPPLGKGRHARYRFQYWSFLVFCSERNTCHLVTRQHIECVVEGMRYNGPSFHGVLDYMTRMAKREHLAQWLVDAGALGVLYQHFTADYAPGRDVRYDRAYVTACFLQQLLWHPWAKRCVTGDAVFCARVGARLLRWGELSDALWVTNYILQNASLSLLKKDYGALCMGECLPDPLSTWLRRWSLGRRQWAAAAAASAAANIACRHPPSTRHTNA